MQRTTRNIRPTCLLVLYFVLFSYVVVAIGGPKDNGGKKSETTDDASIIRTKVAILGAGMSGAAAANELSRRGIQDWVAVEARHVVGGRLQQAKCGPYTVEIGGNWVEGTDGNPVWDLAKKYNLSGVLTDWNNKVIYGAGGPIEDKDGVTRRISNIFGQLQSLAIERDRQNRQDISLRAALEMNGWYPKTPVDKVLEYYLNDYFMAEAPEMTSFSDATSSYTHKDFRNEDYFVTDRRGYQYIPQMLMREAMSLAGASAKLLLNTIVTHITYDQNGVMIRTHNGKKIIADYAIWTMSLGVLRSDRVNFRPKLPDWKVEAIFSLRMAVFQKIFLTFPQKFWTDNEITLFASERRGYFPVWHNMNAKGYFTPVGGKYLLMVTVTDEEAKRLERKDNEAITREIMQVLREMYGEDIPDAMDITVSRWWNDELFHGSYTNWGIGFSESQHDNLRAPLLNRVFFAGEASSPRYNGHVHGAYFTGREMATNVAKCIDGSCPSMKYYPELRNCEQDESSV
ncbi:amine oxidase [Paraphysoderma sedebokerense]|nr:amine oxidase [Paraphysoderma sedebokerense]